MGTNDTRAKSASKRWVRNRFSTVKTQVLDLNGRLDGGWVVLTCHPIFNIPVWLVRCEDVGLGYTIAKSYGGPQEALRDARRFFDDHGGTLTIDSVAALDSGSDAEAPR